MNHPAVFRRSARGPQTLAQTGFEEIRAQAALRNTTFPPTRLLNNLRKADSPTGCCSGLLTAWGSQVWLRAIQGQSLIAAPLVCGNECAGSVIPQRPCQA